MRLREELYRFGRSSRRCAAAWPAAACAARARLRHVVGCAGLLYSLHALLRDAARARGIQSRCRSYRNFSFFQRSFWVTAIHIMRSHLDTWISRRWRTHVNLPNRVITCSSKVGENATRAHPDGNPLAGSPGILSRAHGGQLCAVSASCLSICSPQPRDACRSLRASARKEPQNHRKSMSAWRAGSWPAATNGCHGARTEAKEASAVSGSREGGGRGAHGRRALAAEEEMAESRQSTYRASEGALAMPAYRCFGIRLATVVEDLSPEGARQTSSL